LPDGKAPDTFGDAAPDLCIEIISPSEDSDETRRKLNEYFAAGAQEVWHLFPDSQRARVFHSSADANEYGPPDDLESGDLLPDFG